MISLRNLYCYSLRELHGTDSIKIKKNIDNIQRQYS